MLQTRLSSRFPEMAKCVTGYSIVCIIRVSWLAGTVPAGARKHLQHDKCCIHTISLSIVERSTDARIEHYRLLKHTVKQDFWNIASSLSDCQLLPLIHSFKCGNMFSVTLETLEANISKARKTKTAKMIRKKEAHLVSSVTFGWHRIFVQWDWLKVLLELCTLRKFCKQRKVDIIYSFFSSFWL